MKNLNLIINITLAVALGILFVLYFSLRSEVKQMGPKPIAMPAGASHIVYLNTDTLNANYDMYIDMVAKLKEKQRKMDDDLNLKKSNYEKNVMDYQDKSKKGLLLRSEAEKIEQQLYYDQQMLNKLYSDNQSQLAEESQRENKKLIYSIMDFLKEYNKNGNYQYILGYAFGSNLLYANDSLNITNEVLKGLNEKYNKEVSRKK
jgi:outer membrane protein